MTTPRTETQLVNRIRAAVAARFPRSWTMKVHGGPMQVVGIPDVIGVVDGRFFGIEVKHRKPGESEEHARARATPGQLRMIETLRDAGAIAGVVLTVEEALALVITGLNPSSGSPEDVVR